ncbi:hypothetical protein C5167_008136 [Papaver somniferum]|uniref:Uncharacterized protein n=1 Tax=Papaver somniferum TaxID=3469 RepID=A0A4Y7JXK7_PAPSO|nr:hypothetical protein C5167_008136 [Papaver somniferum]
MEEEDEEEECYFEFYLFRKMKSEAFFITHEPNRSCDEGIHFLLLCHLMDTTEKVDPGIELNCRQSWMECGVVAFCWNVRTAVMRLAQLLFVSFP